MTREIKFRAWDKKQNEMVYFGSAGYTPVGLGFVASNSDYRWKNDLELMQYTGLKDKNGKEIYEGDILNHHGKIWQVNFTNGWFQVDQIGNTPSPDGGEFPPDSDLLGNQYEVCEVIGNIYENKELL